MKRSRLPLAVWLLLTLASLAWAAPKTLPQATLEPLGEGVALSTASLASKPALLVFFTPT